MVTLVTRIIQGVSEKVDLFVFVPVVEKIIEPQIIYLILWEYFFHFERHILVQVKKFPKYYKTLFQNF